MILINEYDKNWYYSYIHIFTDTINAYIFFCGHISSSEACPDTPRTPGDFVPKTSDEIELKA